MTTESDRSAPAWRTVRIVALALLALCVPAALFGEPLLRAAGEWLVVRDPAAPASAIAITLDSGAAGALEAADLVRRGLAAQVIVFAEPVRPAAREFERRGVAHEDLAQRQVRQLAQLGVDRTVRLPSLGSAGTHAEAASLAQWCREEGIGSVIVVTTADHSRRMRRIMQRTLAPIGVQVSVQPARFSDFDATAWWRTTDGRRIVVVEWQKLTLDWLAHPLSP